MALANKALLEKRSKMMKNPETRVRDASARKNPQLEKGKHNAQ